MLMSTTTTTLIVLAGAFLAFSNGANDNFKGVATLFGSRTASYKTALAWATFTTLAGSVAAFFLAQKLMVSFSGKGLVPDSIVGTTSFSAAIAIAGAGTVFLATRFGFPISTTHALTGALVGAGLFADSTGVNGGKLLSAFLLPLLVSPVLSIVGAVLIYPSLSALKKRLGVSRESCLCIGNEVLVVAPSGVPIGASAAMLQMACAPQISIGTNVTCEERYIGEVWGVSAKTVLDSAHFISAGLVSFARGLNDTPKIASILLIGGLMPAMPAILVVAVAIALGGVLMSRRIAQTMSLEITEMNDGQGFSANLITSAIVIGASQLGMPVSTTHVSCGALFGIGSVNGKAHWGSIFKIVMAWVVTLPVAGTLGYVGFWILKGLAV
jgi:PiT family inorganic phosphate transporter